MQTRQPNSSDNYHDLAADIDGIHRELHAAIRNAWLHGAVAATVVVLAFAAAAYLLG